MGNVLITIKIMPESPSTDLNEIEKEARTFMESIKVRVIDIIKQPIAFGLNALIIRTESPESLGSEIIEQHLSKIKNISSVTIEDYRRAFG